MGKAARLFNGSGDQTLYKRLTPSPEQREFLQEQWNDLADYLKAELSAYGYPISTWIQGSYKFGTLIKPVHFGDEYDVDVGVYFEWEEEDRSASPSPLQLRNWVHQHLVAYGRKCNDLKRIEEPPKERCSRATYKKQFHIDVPVYHFEPLDDRRRLACLSDKWEDSDPKAIYKWFRDAVSDSDREQLRRVVRYLKGWAAIAFRDAPEARPSSILLTVLAAEAFADAWLNRLVEVDDEDALIDVVRRIHRRLCDDRKVPNPVNHDENLNRISGDGWQTFLTNLQALRNAADEASAAADEPAAALAWSSVFSYLMPLPEAEAVEVLDDDTGRAVMQLPEIEIEVYKRGSDQLVTKHRNEVPGVAKDCDLIFKIVNPHIVPPFATVEWTVRNEGQEADAIGDLGHRSVGVDMLTNKEHTSYFGRHSMDCVISLNGRVYAVRRVPVTVRDVSYPVRNPPRPSYTKLLSRRGRRR